MKLSSFGFFLLFLLCISSVGRAGELVESRVCRADGIETYSWVIGVGARRISVMGSLSRSKEIFATANDALERLALVSEELSRMASVKADCKLLFRSFVENIRPGYLEAKEILLSALRTAPDPIVENGWLTLEENYANLLSNF
jgi:hypothetical protein